MLICPAACSFVSFYIIIDDDIVAHNCLALLSKGEWKKLKLYYDIVYFLFFLLVEFIYPVST